MCGPSANRYYICNSQWKSGVSAEITLHSIIRKFVTSETAFEELYLHMNRVIENLGYVNLDFLRNLSHSIVKKKKDRIYIEKGNTSPLGNVLYFTFEPHICLPNTKYGHKHENIYFFHDGVLKEL